MNRPILAAFMFSLVLSAGILVLSYRPVKAVKAAQKIRRAIPDVSFGVWWTKTRNSEEHRKAIKENITPE